MVNISKTSRSLFFCIMLALMNQPTHAMFPDKKSLAIPPNQLLPKLPKEILARINNHLLKGFITYIENNQFPLKHTLQGHTDGLFSANFNPNGENIITASYDKTVRIWDVETGEQMNKLQHTHSVFNAKFGLNGKKFYYSSDDDYRTLNRQTRIWDIKKKKIEKVLDGPIKCREPSWEELNNDIADYKWSEHKNRITDFKLTLSNFKLKPDVKVFLYYNFYNNTVEIRNFKTKKIMNTLQGHTDSIYKAKFSKNKKIILTASKDNTVKIWNAQTGQILHTLYHPNVFCAKLSPNSQILVTLSNKEVRVWDPQTYQLLHTLEEHLLHTIKEYWTRIIGFKFSPNSEILAILYSNTVIVLNTQIWKKLRTIRGIWGSFKFSPNSKKIVTRPRGTTTAEILDNEWRENNLNWLGNNLLPHQAEIIRRAFKAKQSNQPFIIGKDSEKLTLLGSLPRDRQQFLKAYLDIKISQSICN